MTVPLSFPAVRCLPGATGVGAGGAALSLPWDARGRGHGTSVSGPLLESHWEAALGPAGALGQRMAEASACERRAGIYCILSWPLKHLGPEGGRFCLAQGSLIKQFPPAAPAASTLPSGASQSPRWPEARDLLKLRPLPAGLGAERSRGPCLKSGQPAGSGPTSRCWATLAPFSPRDTGPRGWQ